MDSAVASQDSFHKSAAGFGGAASRSSRVYAISGDNIDRRLFRDSSCDRAQMVSALKKVLSDSLPLNVSARDLSECFCVSQRTFNRRLNDAGLTYRELLEDVRKELAVEYLCRDDLMISDVARKLGYSEASNLTKAFRKWMNCTPRDFRKNRPAGQTL